MHTHTTTFYFDRSCCWNASYWSLSKLHDQGNFVEFSFHIVIKVSCQLTRKELLIFKLLIDTGSYD